METTTVKTAAAPDRKDKDLPVLRGLVSGARLVRGEQWGAIKVWCEACADHHLHGWRLGDVEPQHRAAHCLDGPFNRGYLIAPLPPGVPEHAPRPRRARSRNSATPADVAEAGR